MRGDLKSLGRKAVRARPRSFEAFAATCQGIDTGVETIERQIWRAVRASKRKRIAESPITSKVRATCSNNVGRSKLHAGIPTQASIEYCLAA
jgi:hypothetical protein